MFSLMQSRSDKAIPFQRFFAGVFCVATLLLFLAVPKAHADFLGCAISGENIADCLSQESEDQTSFTNFDGGLTAPSTAGYATGLTQATSAREFIVNVTNFAVGFLGLIAMVIMIYGGFLYITARGEDDGMQKGKKAISFAIIGIIIILASYAVVSTILLAPSGDDRGQIAAGDINAGGTSAEQQASRRALFNLAASTVNTVARDFATAYQNYAEINIDIEELLRVPEVNRADDLHALLTQKRQILERIQQKSGTYSLTREQTQEALNVINGYLQNSQQALAAAVDDHQIWEAEYWQNNVGNFQTDLQESLGENGLKMTNAKDFALAVVESYEQVEELRARIAKSVDIVKLADVRVAFDDLALDLQSLATGSTISASANLEYPPSNTDMFRILKKMGILSDVVKDILFIHTVITADTVEGNAPLIVQFDGLQSLDPLNRTIQSNAYKWDFGDNGVVASDMYGLNQNTGPAVIHVFTEPGTYVVQLTVESPAATSDDEVPVADGVAYTYVTVHPPVTKISLTSRVGQTEFPLRLYDDVTGNLLVDRGVLKVTPAEAQAGIQFDASATDSNRIQSVVWDFGDNSGEVVGTGSSLQLQQTHSYSEIGTYPVVLEVTDIQNNVDRKIVNVVVDNPIARMTIQPGNKVFVNQEFTLDAGSSSSEGGQIESFNWSASNQDALETSGVTNFETYSAKYTEPGLNQIELTVADSLGGEDTEVINIVVESKAPEAQFSVEQPYDNQPAVYTFDGNLSYDPDGEGPLAYKWEVNGQESGSNFSFIEGTNNTSAKPMIQFLETGTYSVALTAIDPNGFGPGIEQEGSLVEKEVIVDDILGVAWGGNDNVSSALIFNEDTEQASAAINLNIVSQEAVAYEVDWGDGETESAEMNGTKSLQHNYTEAGMYVVTATVFDDDDNERSIARKIFISSSDIPIAAINLSINGQQVFDTTGVITINRGDSVNFDAGESLNTDGTGRRLNYSWDFANGERSTQREVSQRFRELGSYQVSLKVTNANDVQQVSPPDTVTLEVIGEPPILRSITAVPTGSDLTTPVTVQINALGAEDPDGQITRYRWWYYDPSDSTEERGVQVTSSPNATITIGTRGLEGEQRTYKFAVEMTDDENNTISSRALLSEDRTATLEVTNGPNNAPIAEFSVDRTSITVGESINFSSSSRDTDGTITDYYWDFEGDGFANNSESLGSSVSHTFTKAAPEGVRVRLKVRDNNESEATSDPVTIYVDTVAGDPVASFEAVQQGQTRQMVFTDSSTADTENGAELVQWTWDFDLNTDSNGDGIKDNDIDATIQNPTHEYPEYGVYRAQLKVTDNQGATSTLTQFVNAKIPIGSISDTMKTIDARLLTLPASNSEDGKVYLNTSPMNVTFDYSTSIGNIVQYRMDKNILFDTNGNGILDDDQDHIAVTPGTWTTDFDATWGKIIVRLTVLDKNGQKDTVEKEIIFGEPPQL